MSLNMMQDHINSSLCLGKELPIFLLGVSHISKVLETSFFDQSF